MTPHELAEAMDDAASEDEQFVGHLRGESRARLAKRAALLRAGAQAMREAYQAPQTALMLVDAGSYVLTLPEAP